MTTRRRGSVAAPRREALEAGESILDAGGNAVDAVVAMSLVQAVCEPYMTGPGGIGEAIYLTPETSCIVMDAIGLAPRRASTEMFCVDETLGLHPRGWPRVAGDQNTFGIKAVTAPRLLSGLTQLHSRYGHLPWSELVDPALREARRGASIDYFSAAKIAISMPTLERDPFAASLYYRDGVPTAAPITEAPVLVRNEPLIGTLELIRSAGARAMSDGSIGRAIVAHSRSLGGILDESDVCSEAGIGIDVTPLVSFGDWDLYGSPNPSGAPTVATILALLDRVGLDGVAVNSALKYRAVLKACATAMHERWEKLAGDTDESTVRTLLANQYLDELMQVETDYSAASIAAMPSSSTTHCCACDVDGGACAMTTTLVTSFGAHVAVPDCGIFLNNGMQWFDPRPDYPTSIAPGKRGMTAMSPLILRNRATDRLLVLSGIGGVPIITGIAQAAHDILRFGVPVADAVDLPRVHAQVTSRGALTGFDERLGEAARDTLSLKGLPVPAPWHYGPTSMQGGRLVGIDYDRESGATSIGIDQRSRAVWSFGRRPEYELRVE